MTNPVKSDNVKRFITEQIAYLEVLLHIHEPGCSGVECPECPYSHGGVCDSSDLITKIQEMINRLQTF